MDVKAALLAMATAGLLSLIAACGGESAEPGSGNSASAPSGSSGSASSGGGSSGSGSGSSGSGSSGSGASSSGSASTFPPDRTGTVMGSCGSTPTVTVSWFDSLSYLALDAPMVFLAQPGPITATVLATPVRDLSWSYFSTNYSFTENAKPMGRDLGITGFDTAGKSVSTVSIPGQPAGVPIVFSAHFNDNGSVFGTTVITGFVYENAVNGAGCCDEQRRVAAEITFGANNTAIVSFLPGIWGPTTPLRIQLTNVTSASGCEARKGTG